MLRRTAILSSAVRVALLVIIAPTLCAFGISKAATSGQPTDERQAQDGLPQSHDSMWAAFGRCKVHVDEQNYLYSIDFTPEVKALEGKTVSVSGFMLPLEAEPEFTHYLLSKRTPTCPFCPPGEPNEIVEVFSKQPVKWEDGIITVTGVMKFTDKSENGLFFQMNDGEILNSDSIKSKRLLPAF